MTDLEHVRAAVSEIVSTRLEGTEIVSVDVSSDEDADGEEILRVVIVFDAGKKRLDPKRVAGLLRRLRPRLLEDGEKRFPLLSFISKVEAGKGFSPEAA